MSHLLRLLIQQSNCFIVVESEPMGSGEMRSGSNFGKGQMVASGFEVTDRRGRRA